jgi:hypothetical protein
MFGSGLALIGRVAKRRFFSESVLAFRCRMAREEARYEAQRRTNDRLRR